MKVVINKSLKVRLLKALTENVYDTALFPEFATDGQREFLNLMQQSTSIDNQNKDNGNDTIK